MLEGLWEFLASDIGRNLLTSLAAALTIAASAYAFLRWLKRRYDGFEADPSQAMETPRHKMRSFRRDLADLRFKGQVTGENLHALIREYGFTDKEYNRALQALNMGELHHLTGHIKKTGKKE